mgnify:CR=1 FL=1|jgi:hypothetical protein
MDNTPHKRYLVFAGVNYQSCGGLDDLSGDYDNLDEAVNECKRLDIELLRPKKDPYGWIQLYDRLEGVLIDYEKI